MKKLFFLFAFVGIFGLTTVNAQCTHGQAKATKTAALENDAVAQAAAKYAANDETIESRTCSKSGKVSYYKKTVGEGGDVSYAPVTFDMDAKAFVMAAPAQGCAKGAKGAKGCCKGGSAKGCSKGAAASGSCTKAQMKACGPNCKKACCAGKNK